MRTSIFLILGAFTLSLFGQGNTIDWRDGRPGVRVVTNSLQAGQIMGLIDAAGQAKAGTGDVARIEGELAAHTNNAAIHLTPEQVVKIDAAITSAPPQNVISVNGQTGAVVITAGELGALTQESDPIALPLLAAHTNDTPIHLTPEQAQRIANAVTNEQDLAALRTYHYGSPDIIESPTNWFVFDGAGTITAFNWEAGRTNVVIPWAIGGVPVTAVGYYAFGLSGIVSLIAPQTVTSIGDNAFLNCYLLTSILLPQAQTVGVGAFASCEALTSILLPQAQTVGGYAFHYCYSLTSIPLPQAQTVGGYAFASCYSLASISLPQAQTLVDGAFYSCYALTSVYFDNDAPTIGTNIFEGITPNQVTNYVTNPQATGWGTTLGGMPVVRPPLYADAITLGGVSLTNWPSGGADLTGAVFDFNNGGITNLYQNLSNIITRLGGTVTNYPTFD